MVLLRRRDPTTRADPGTSPAALPRCASPHPLDFGAIYDRYFPAVYGYCLSQLGDPPSAEDAASQTFLKALQALPSYRETGRFRPWLFAIAHNVLLDIHRGRRPDDPLDAAIQVHDPVTSPEERALAALDADWLDRAIARLHPDDRKILEFRRVGLSGRVIAATLGIGHEAAKKRQLRAMDRIRAELTTSTELGEVRHGA